MCVCVCVCNDDVDGDDDDVLKHVRFILDALCELSEYSYLLARLGDEL